MKLKFNLKWLFLLLLVVALLMAWLTHYGMSRALIKVTQVNLVQDDDEIVSGEILWRFSDLDRHVHRYVAGSFSNMQRLDLMDIKPDDTFRFRYRSWEFWPFKRQPPSGIFLTQKLKIPKQQITGYLTYQHADAVVIDGSK